MLPPVVVDAADVFIPRGEQQPKTVLDLGRVFSTVLVGLLLGEYVREKPCAATRGSNM